MTQSPRPFAPNPHLDVSTILADSYTRVIVCCGAGGVGKTTTAAALAMRAAENGRHVVVLTIDPARRLAQALGVAELGNTPQPVTLPPGALGRMDAMMLNMRRTFDDMVIEHTSPEQAEQIFANPFYQTVSSSFGGTQEYMAMEKLGQLAAQGSWDLIVVDTPPSRNALDFLDAPKRLGTLLNSRMFRLIMTPSRGIGRLVTGAMGLAIKGVSTVIGGQMLSDASLFMQSLESMFGGFQERANRTYELLSRRSTHFLVVAAAEPDALREAAFFVDRLTTDRMPLAGLVLNRTHPTYCDIAVEHSRSAADWLDRQPSTPERALAGAMLRVHTLRAIKERRENHLLQRFVGAHPQVPIARVPVLPFEVADLAGLRAVANELTRQVE